LGIGLEIPDLAEGNFRNLTVTAQLNVIARLSRHEPVSIIGSSMGGYLAALFAARHPGNVEKLALLAPAFSFASRWPETLGEPAMEQRFAEAFVGVFQLHVFPDDGDAYFAGGMMQPANEIDPGI